MCNASGKEIDIFYSKIFWKFIEQFSSSIKKPIFHEIRSSFLNSKYIYGYAGHTHFLEG